MSNSFVAGWISISLVIFTVGCSAPEKKLPDPWVKPWERSWQESLEPDSRSVPERELRCRANKIRPGMTVSMECI